MSKILPFAKCAELYVQDKPLSVYIHDFATQNRELSEIVSPTNLETIKSILEHPNQTISHIQKIEQLGDVAINSVSDHDYLIYEKGKWSNKNIADIQSKMVRKKDNKPFSTNLNMNNNALQCQKLYSADKASTTKADTTANCVSISGDIHITDMDYSGIRINNNSIEKSGGDSKALLFDVAETKGMTITNSAKCENVVSKYINANSVNSSVSIKSTGDQMSVVKKTKTPGILIESSQQTNRISSNTQLFFKSSEAMLFLPNYKLNLLADEITFNNVIYNVDPKSNFDACGVDFVDYTFKQFLSNEHTKTLNMIRHINFVPNKSPNISTTINIKNMVEIGNQLNVKYSSIAQNEVLVNKKIVIKKDDRGIIQDSTNVNSGTIESLGDPIEPSDIANKKYIDDIYNRLVKKLAQIEQIIYNKNNE